jgi:hypothetical protein
MSIVFHSWFSAGNPVRNSVGGSLADSYPFLHQIYSGDIQDTKPQTYF